MSGWRRLRTRRSGALATLRGRASRRLASVRHISGYSRDVSRVCTTARAGGVHRHDREQLPHHCTQRPAVSRGSLHQLRELPSEHRSPQAACSWAPPPTTRRNSAPAASSSVADGAFAVRRPISEPRRSVQAAVFRCFESMGSAPCDTKANPGPQRSVQAAVFRCFES